LNFGKKQEPLMSNKNVKIYFDGLMVFSFLDQQSDTKFQECRVGILTLAGGHEVTLEITRERLDHPDEKSYYCFPHDLIKKFKHLWLYLPQEGESQPCDSSVTRHPSFDNIFRMERFYNPKPVPIWDAMRPTLHITTGEFRTAICNNDEIFRLVDVEGVTNLLTPLFHADPTAVKNKLEMALDHFTKSHKEVGKLANVFWTDIDVKDDQRLALAIGDERDPSIELFSVKPRAGEFIRVSLTNMPSYDDPIGSAHLAHQVEALPDNTDSPGDSHGHHGDQASLHADKNKTDKKKEENRMKYLKRRFHFLNYYDVLKLEKGQKQYVLLRDDRDWIEGSRKRSPVPDPPCDSIEV